MSFAAGDTVSVRDDWPETRGPAHIRTPHYVRAVIRARVIRYLGEYSNPEDHLRVRPPGGEAQALILRHLCHEGIEARGGARWGAGGAAKRRTGRGTL